MKTLIKRATAVAIIVIMSLLVAAQRSDVKCGSSNQFPAAMESHRTLAASYAQVAAVRITSRKATYRFGDVMTLDVALLNKTNRALFFRKLEMPSLAIKAKDETGKTVRVIAD